MTDRVMDRLEQARRLTLELRTLEEEYGALQPAPATPRLDGMPRAQPEPDAALVALVDARNALISLMMSKRVELADLHEWLKPKVCALELNLYVFCMHYYISAKTMQETARQMNRTERCIYDYKRRLAQALDGAGGGQEAG